LVQDGIQIQTLSIISQTKYVSARVETSNLTMQSGQSKFIFWERKANMNFGKFIRVLQKVWIPNKFNSNSKMVLLPEFFI
jgi:hypothetical protein